MKLKIGLVLIVCLIQQVHAQSFYDTSVPNKLVEHNLFKEQEQNFSKPPSFEKSRGLLPVPVWDSRPDVIETYWKTWQIAFSNLKAVKKENGFISPYIDPAFNSNIFMWDCSFMTMYGKYGARAFNFQRTLDNFYVKQHKDGFICREIRGSDGTDVFAKFDHSSTGPNIMPWSEWEYYLNTGDKNRLTKVFPVLLAYYEWYQMYRRWPDGSYFSTGWGCGMDNQYRMDEKYNQAWHHGFMSWVDITMQEIFAGKILIQMANEIDRTADVLKLQKDVSKLSQFVIEFMWDDDKHFYFDRYQNGNLSDVMSIASYWALLAKVSPKEKLNKFVNHLSDTSKFARTHRVPTLSASDKNFVPEGGYWNGSVWAPTNYMVLRGLTENDFDSLAHQIGLNHVNNVVQVYQETQDLNENYAPDFVKGNDRGQFVGWTGLAPISVLLEYVFGIRPQANQKQLVLDVNLLDKYGVRNYPFGKSDTVNIIVQKRNSRTDKPIIEIETSSKLELVLKWGNNQEVYQLQKGRHTLN